jgi:hypothetical protein
MIRKIDKIINDIISIIKNNNAKNIKLYVGNNLYNKLLFIDTSLNILKDFELIKDANLDPNEYSFKQSSNITKDTNNFFDYE